MAPFAQWIGGEKRPVILGHVNGELSSRGAIWHEVPCLNNDGLQAQVFQSDDKLLTKQICLDDRVTIYPIDDALNEVKEWRANGFERERVCIKLVDHLLTYCKPGPGSEEPLKVKYISRANALKKTLASVEQLTDPLPDVRYSLVVPCVVPSLLSFVNRILPSLLAGVPLTVVTSAHCAVQVAYLCHLFYEAGGPKSVLNHLIDFQLKTRNDTVVYILTESTDTYSAVESIIQTYLVSGFSHFKIYAQESLSNILNDLLQDKLLIQYPDEALFHESELFELHDPSALVHLDSMDIQSCQPGIFLHYFRNNTELLSMINYKPNSTRFVSIWCENTGLAHKMARSIRSSGQILINTWVTPIIQEPAWQIQLAEQVTWTTFAATLKLQKSSDKWASLSSRHRARLLADLLQESKLDVFDDSLRATLCHLSLSSRSVDEDLSGNELRIDYHRPIGQIVLLIDSTWHQPSPSLAAYLLAALVAGNTLVVCALNSDLLHSWQAIGRFLDARQPDSRGVVQTMVTDHWPSSDQAVRILVDTESAQRRVQSLFIDQSQWNSTRHLAPLPVQQLHCSISISLQEFEMKNMVE